MPVTTADAAEKNWLETIYQPTAPQLTLRAVLSGMAIGALMCLSNLYVVLKTGWSLGVTITACILAFGVFRSLNALGVSKREFGMLENNAASSVASAAGYMTGGGNMAAVPALLLLTGIRPDSVSLMAWFALISALGVCVAIPIKRQLINREQLAFPTGRATAETLQLLYAGGSARASVKWLGWGSAAGAIVAILRSVKELPWRLAEQVSLPLTRAGLRWSEWTMSLDTSLMLFGGGALMSFRTGWSMLLGATVNYFVIAPWLLESHIIENTKFKSIMTWSLWPGAGILVASGMVAFAMQWRMIVRAARMLMNMTQRKPSSEHDPLADIECPTSWFVYGLLLLSPPLVWMMKQLFGIPVWAGVVAIPLALLMGFVAARVTGETDVTPTKALGPVTQMAYGVMLPGNIAANVMSANVTGGIGLHAADLLTDLKSGYLLGARPRGQFVAQLFGVLAGAVAIVPAYNLLIPDASMLGSAEFPAPSVQVWAGVAKILSEGVAGLSQTARLGALCGVILGCVLALADHFAPPKIKKFLPSASGLGIAMVIPGYNSISMFFGAAVAEWIRRRRAADEKPKFVPLVSGLIAGESLLGIGISMLKAFAVLEK